MDLRHIEARLIALLERVPPGIPAAQLADMKSLAEAGEPGLALESFWTQLDEHGVFVPPDMVREIDAIAAAMGIAVPSWVARTGTGATRRIAASAYWAPICAAVMAQRAWAQIVPTAASSIDTRGANY